MGPRLLDSSVLIALVVADHEHHERATRWRATVEAVATCPITEGALARFLVRVGESKTVIKEILTALHQVPGHVFWPDDVSYVDLDLSGVRGYRQVTDAYLVALAAHHGGVLSTLDEALAVCHPAAELLPSV